jgi:hypothetical protein
MVGIKKFREKKIPFYSAVSTLGFLEYQTVQGDHIRFVLLNGIIYYDLYTGVMNRMKAHMTTPAAIAAAPKARTLVLVLPR